MKGWIYRRAMNLKDMGERIRPRFIGDIIRDIGLAVRDWVLRNSTAGEFMGTRHRGK